MNISIVIPLKNEEGNIADLVQECITSATACEAIQHYEIICVNDGSTDTTASILDKLAVSNDSLRIITHQKSYGQSAAIYSGVHSAQHEYIATLDGDGQNDPADIPLLIDKLADNVGMVTGYRKKRQDNLLRRLASKFANAVRGAILRDNCPDSACGIKVVRTEIFLSLPFFKSMHRFMPALVQAAGFGVLHVQVNHRPRLQGETKYTTIGRAMAGLIDLFGVSWLIRRSIIAAPPLENQNKSN